MSRPSKPKVKVRIEGGDLLRRAMADAWPSIEKAIKRAIADALKSARP